MQANVDNGPRQRRNGLAGGVTAGLLPFYAAYPWLPISMNPEDNAATFTWQVAQFDAALARLAQAGLYGAKPSNAEVLEIAGALLAQPGGPEALYARVASIESAGVFTGTDWAKPHILQPALAVRSLRQGQPATTAIEALSELRLLAVASGHYFHFGISAERARNFLTQVMALNLDLLSGQLNEADRERPRGMGLAVQALYRYQLEQMGYESILDSLVDEVWRMLAQRPIQVDSVRRMIIQIAECLFDPELAATGGDDRAARLVGALFGPAPGCREDPGLTVYAQRLSAMDAAALTAEAIAFARSMHDTGLASVYHAAFLHHLRGLEGNAGNDLIPTALGLSSTGRDALLCYHDLIYTLIDEAVFAETSQAVYGLARLLERGILYSRPVAPALWRQIGVPLCEAAEQRLAELFGRAQSPRAFLLAGVLNMLGQPLGVGQGNNPTCQSVRALSMWAYNDPDYLLQIVVWATRDDEVIMHFEGRRLSSAGLQAGLAAEPPLDVDALSLIVVPHLDRLYMEMARLCDGREGDPHRWINPEFHGWWVGRGFCIAVDVATGQLDDYAGFIRDFYGYYHPYYNGNLPVIHPQPAGIAVTDSAARFVGWHAITIIRVTLDPDSVTRVYFFNPNNDSGQDWGQGIVTATQGNGEIYGEASLPIAEFAARLYVFHYDPLERGNPQMVPDDDIARVMELGKGSWAAER